MFDNFVSALGDRFRQQYPQGSIISDLVQVHGDQYVVKVSVSEANTVLTTALAADANLMLAENQAIARALTILGIRDVQQPVHEPVNLIVTPLPDLPTSLTNFGEQSQVSKLVANIPVNSPEPVVTLVETTDLPIMTTKGASEAIEVESLAPVADVPAAAPIRIQVGVASEISEQSMKFDTAPVFSEPVGEVTMPTTNGKVAIDSAPPEIPATSTELPITNLPEPEVLVAKSSRTKKATTTAEDDSPAVTAPEITLDENIVPIAEPPISVTDMIPMINMELKRLGWSKDRGRDYMVSLYNKRASALLSDDELFGLLQHLQAEPVV